MKKFLTEFKAFAMKGNVLELAVAVILGAAFGKVVNAVVEIFLNPIMEALPKMENGGTGFTGSLISFAAVVVEFLLTALVLFLIIKAFNKAKDLKKKEEAPAEPTLLPERDRHQGHPLPALHQRAEGIILLKEGAVP